MKTQRFFIALLFIALLVAGAGQFFRAKKQPALSSPLPAPVPYFAFPQNPVASPRAEISQNAAGSMSQPDAASSSVVQSASGEPLVQAEAAYAGNIESGASSYAKNSGARWPLASLSKLMTAAITLKHFSLNDVVTIAPDAFQMSAAEADPVPLEVGQSYRVKDLLMMMLLPSSNKAADALAASVGRDTFIADMNAQALSWGMNDTHFEEPTGLSVLDQSTARDLAALARHLYLEDPDIFLFTRETEYAATEIRSGKTLEVKSINAFAGQADFLGGKTGYTDEANGNLLSLFVLRGQPLVVVVMGTSDRFGQTQKIKDWLEKTGEGG